MVDETYQIIKEIKDYAKENKVPIMEDAGIDFLTNFIIKNQRVKVLEVGTAIGYSAIMMALCNKNLKVTSIERDSERYMEALKNIKDFGLEKRITLILGDALDLDIKDKYDLIFIDAAKGQYTKFFKKYSNNLKDDGVIITDNIAFHGLVEQEERIKNKNLRQLVDKIKRYITFLNENTSFNTRFYKVGDGISVSKLKCE